MLNEPKNFISFLHMSIQNVLNFTLISNPWKELEKSAPIKGIYWKI